MNVKCLLITSAVAFGLIFGSAPAWSAQDVVSAKVKKVLLVADETWGGCMANLSVSPATVLPSCKDDWVTFSCSGDFTTELRAYRMLDQAQLALATGKTVRVVIQDTKMHNGYCFAWRLDILR